MACGGGKTLIALRVAEKVTQAFSLCAARPESQAGKPAPLILILVTSLALLRQTLHEWTRENSWPALAPLCVCSDPSVKAGSDEIVLRPSDLDFPVTTDRAQVRAFLAAPFAGVKLVFSTSQSAHVVAAGMQRGDLTCISHRLPREARLRRKVVRGFSPQSGPYGLKPRTTLRSRGAIALCRAAYRECEKCGLTTGLAKKYGQGGTDSRRLFGVWYFPDRIKPIESVTCMAHLNDGTVSIAYGNVPMTKKAEGTAIRVSALVQWREHGFSETSAIAPLPPPARSCQGALMSTLAEIEAAADSLPLKQQRKLLEHLTSKLTPRRTLPKPSMHDLMKDGCGIVESGIPDLSTNKRRMRWIPAMSSPPVRPV